MTEITIPRAFLRQVNCFCLKMIKSQLNLINMFNRIKGVAILSRGLHFRKNNLGFFSKEAGKKEAGKKTDAKGAPPAESTPLIQETPITEILAKWVKPNHPSLSPSQLKMLNEGFEDLSAQDKQILDSLALRLLDLPTAIFYDVMKKGALGTTDMYYTAVQQMPSTEIANTIKHLRKQI